LARRDKPFLNEKRVLIFCDEAHMCGSDSWIEHVFRAYPNAIIIGWTATPTRLDGRPLGGELFEVLIQISTYTELLKRPDWLVAPDCFGAPIRADLSQVRVAGSDYDEEMLAQVMHTDILEGQIIEHWFRLANKYPVIDGAGVRVPEQFTDGEYRRTLVFCVNILHSQAVAARFEKSGVKVAHVDGNTKEETRKNIWRDLASGQLQVVTNCNIAVAGVDVPPIKCIMHARPTQSLVLWRQSVGREMRPWNNVIPLLLDHAGNWDRLGCPFEDRIWSLTHRPARVSGKLPMKLCKTCFAYVEPGKAVCPFCGTEFPKFEAVIPAETSAELVLRQSEPDALKAAYFWRNVTLSKQKGFKPAFASALYKEYYGEWPPDAWKDKVKADFAADKVWQGTLSRRLERKNAREAREKEEREAVAVPKKKQVEMAPIEPEEIELDQALEQTVAAMDAEGSSEFGDWVKEQGIK
jgi:superfamily II DNA or RNA helicase